MANDFDLAHFRHVTEVFSFSSAEQCGGVYCGHIEGRKLPRGFARRRFLEDQAFVLIDVAGSFARLVPHRATSSASSFAGRSEALLSSSNPAAASIAVRVVSSVQHHNAALPSSG